MAPPSPRIIGSLRTSRHSSSKPHCSKSDTHLPARPRSTRAASKAASNVLIALASDETDYVLIENTSNGRSASLVNHALEEMQGRLAQVEKQIQALEQERDTRKKRERDALNCAVCLSVNFHPRILSCGHTFCETCLVEHYRARQREEAHCPMCRQPIPAYTTPPVLHQLQQQVEEWARAEGIRIPAALPFEWPPREIGQVSVASPLTPEPSIAMPRRNLRMYGRQGIRAYARWRSMRDRPPGLISLSVETVNSLGSRSMLASATSLPA